ncbi:hypothetical protein J3459_012399 [Metarhizium acridum]|nr:hypothetical protein J3459_012399 [Metarhizium acridum]
MARLVGQIFGLFVNGVIADRFGYRKTLIGALVGCIAFIFIVFFAESLTQLLIGQMLIGVPWGVFQTLTTHICPPRCCPYASANAYLTTYVNLCWVMGQFIASGVLRAMVSRDDKWGYKIPFALQWMWPLYPCLSAIYLAPESPWWLFAAIASTDAKKSLARSDHPQHRHLPSSTDRNHFHDGSYQRDGEGSSQQASRM